MQVQFRDYYLRPDHTSIDKGDTLYVHLCSGNVVEVYPATAVRVTDHEVIVLDGDETVATFARDDVYFAAGEDMEPASFG